jgi:hypothetical protein
MPKLDLCFSGWLRGADIKKATDQNGKTIDVVGMPADELAKKLNAGELFISLGDHLYNSNDSEIEMFDFVESA